MEIREYEVCSRCGLSDRNYVPLFCSAKDGKHEWRTVSITEQKKIEIHNENVMNANNMRRNEAETFIKNKELVKIASCGSWNTELYFDKKTRTFYILDRYCFFLKQVNEEEALHNFHLKNQDMKLTNVLK